MPGLILEPFRRSTYDAERFACAAHAGQIDKASRPYREHVARVADQAWLIAAQMKVGVGKAGETRSIAWLHDVIEDTAYDADHLRREGFSDEVVSGVQWLTKTGNEPYADWIDRLCAEAPLAVLIVKLADIEDNSDSERLSKLDEATQARLRKKYEPAVVKLRAAIAGRDRG